MATNAAIGVMFGVGADKVDLPCVYDTTGGFSAELKSPARLGPIRSILTENGVSSDSWPQFAKDVLDIEATINVLFYKGRYIGVITKGGTAPAETFDLQKSEEMGKADLPSELKGVALKVVTVEGSLQLQASADGNTALKELKDFTVTPRTKEKETDKETWDLTNKYFTFAAFATYPKDLAIVKGLIYVKSIAFAVSTDPVWKNQLTDVLSASLAGKPLERKELKATSSSDKTKEEKSEKQPVPIS